MQRFGVTNKEYYGMLWYFGSGQLNEPVEHYCDLSFLKNMCANKFQIEQPDSYDYPYIIYVKNLPAWLLLHIPSILTPY